jgi:hypothetical protein
VDSEYIPSLGFRPAIAILNSASVGSVPSHLSHSATSPRNSPGSSSPTAPGAAANRRISVSGDRSILFPNSKPSGNDRMKAAMLTSFNPEEVKIITDAYALALKTFESNEPLSKIHRDILARGTIVLAEEGCLETACLATRAIMRVLL